MFVLYHPMAWTKMVWRSPSKLHQPCYLCPANLESHW